MQCPSCRREASGVFCNFCGATLAAAGAGAPPIRSTARGARLSPNAAAAISYLTIIPSIIFLVMKPYKNMKLVRFHSIQNIALAVAWIVVYAALSIISTALHFIPFIGFLFLFVDLAVAVLFIVAWLVALIKASQGKPFKLPLIGAFAAKQAGI